MYRSRCAIAISGELDSDILVKALQNVVERHELMRTRFHLLPGMTQPLQVISPAAEFGYVWHDLRSLPFAAKQKQCEAILEDSAGQGPDEANGSILRVLHVTLEPSRHLLMLDLPAMCADAVSLHLLGQQIRSAYVCLRDELHIPGASAQYADIAQTLNECVESDDFEFARQSWRERMARSFAQSKSAFESSSSSSSFRPSRAVSVPVSDMLKGMADRFCDQYGISPEGLLLTCWGLLTCRIAAAEEALIGLYCDGRTHDVLREVVGPLSRQVPFEFRLSHHNSFEEIARATDGLLPQIAGEQHYFDLAWTSSTGDATPYEYGASFEYVRLLGCSETEEPIFATDCLFSVQDRFTIKLTAIEVDARLRCQLEYDASLMSEDDVVRIADCFVTLLNSALCNPGLRAPLLEVLKPEEKQAMLAASQGPELRLERLCAHEMFERQAQERSDSVALVYEDLQLSYGELNRRASQLGQYLRLQGVGPETCVGLCLNRGVELVVGLLGVLKAGGAYVPLDATYPTERLAYMLENARARLVITESALLGRLPATARAICLDKEWGLISQCSYADQVPMSTPENLAYVIYTSGSTGRPKAVGIEHSQIVNYVSSISYRLDLCQGWRLALLSSLAADLGYTMLFPSLCLGSELHIVADLTSRDSSLWALYLSQRRIDCLKITPSHFQALLTGSNSIPAKRLILGGEVCSRELINRVRRLDGQCRLYNHYGPTECTVGGVVSQIDDDQEGRVAIGKAIGNVRGYVTDQAGEPVMMRAVGELLLGGSGVGRGYVNDAGATGERFVPDALSGERGARLYRTGDLVRRRPADAELEFLGRVDHQVKVRGYRIEPGEIEAELMKLQAIKQCAVIVKGDSDSDKRLVAYIVPLEGEAASSEQISKLLEQRLPAYMVPSVFVVINEMPLTVNGKVDRKRLPEPDERPEVDGEDEDDRARSAIEEIVAGIWAEVLKVRRVGLDENFFDKGGHSLLATQVMSRVREVMGVEVGLREMFERPTVRGLSEAIEKQRAAGRGREVPAMKRREREAEAELSYAQQRMWFLDQLRPGSSVYNMPVAVRFVVPFNVHVLNNCLSETIRRHEVLRTTFTDAGEQPVQIITEPRFLELPIVDLSELPELEREPLAYKLAEEEAGRPFDLVQGPLIRGQLLKISGDNHVLLFTMHHIVADGWSVRVIINELKALYESFGQGEESPLAELSIQYADFAVWQKGWLKGEVLEAQLAYWKQRLGGQLPPLNIMTDRPRPAVLSYRGAQQERIISKQIGDSVKTLSQDEGVTLFMTLLAAFSVLLHRHTGQRDLIVGTDVANRNWGEIEGIVGFFINQLVMRIDLSGDPTFRELLGRVREVALDAYAHQDLPFEKLVEALKPERSLGRTPIFQVKMILQNIPEVRDKRDQANGRRLISKPLQAEVTRTAEVDMNLIIRDTPQGLVAQLRYSTDLFDDTTVLRFLEDFEAILDGVTTQREMRLSGLLDHIAEAARQELISRRNKIKETRRRRLKSSEPKPVNGANNDEQAGL